MSERGGEGGSAARAVLFGLRGSVREAVADQAGWVHTNLAEEIGADFKQRRESHSRERGRERESKKSLLIT